MRLHPLSVPVRALTRGISVAAGLFFAGTFGGGAFGIEWALLGPALGVVGFAVAAAWEVAYHRRFEYELVGDSLDISSGVVSRRHREIPLGRIQNVDIQRDILARLLGIAVVGFETAGGGQTEARLRYVGYDEARRLQREVGRLKAGVEETAAREAEATTGESDAVAGKGDAAAGEGVAATGEAAATTGEAVAGEAAVTAGWDREAEDLLFELPSEDLVVLSLVSVDPRVASMLFLVGPVVVAQVPETAVARALFLLSAIGTIVAVVGLWLTSAVVTFARYYGFRLSRVGDDLRYERGLLQRYDGSIPVEKLQTLSIRENPLMRRFGYATLAVETAGYAPGQTPSGGSEAAVPLARRERVVSLARSIESFDLGAFERPPKRARRRYAGRYVIVVALLTALLFGIDTFAGPIPLPGPVPLAPLVLLPVVPIAAHYKWLHRGYYLGDDHVLTRNGFWRRTITVVPYYRVQTVIEQQTVFQRRWNLSSVVVDTAGSLSLAANGAIAADLDAGVAADRREEVHRRMQASRSKRRTEAQRR